MPGRVARWKVKEPFAPHKSLIRMSWNKYNLYNLATRTRTPDVSRQSVFAQKWAAKRDLRSYHCPNITERQLIKRHWATRLPMQQFTKAEWERVPPVQALAFAELERRLDVVVFRCHFASSIWEARMAVVRGNVWVNGEKCPFPARRLADGDMITVNPNIVPTLALPGSEPTMEGTAGEEVAEGQEAPEEKRIKLSRSQRHHVTEPLKFKPHPWMAPHMFLPSYLEVSYPTCSAVFLRSPLPQPDEVEVPSPFPPESHQLVYEWYTNIYKRNPTIKTNADLMPGIVVEGCNVTLKPKFAQIRRREDLERRREVRRIKDEKSRKQPVAA
ncbi:mitochondrial 37S ribosomal protein nam9 [Gaertneriomyces sp. JEL0708]|nr:mitochondrial 37S ribosomal protein nam9 [Gaertneriomyces sp. JEL0708]